MRTRLSKSFDSFIRRENKKRYYEEKALREKEKESESSRVSEKVHKKQ